MAEPPGVGEIRQQIGEILGTVKGVSEQLRETKDDLRAFKHQTDRRLDLIVGQVRQLDYKMMTFTADIASLKDGQTKLSEPVQELVELRKRLTRYAVVLVSGLTVFWNVAGPLINEAIKKITGIGS